MRNNDVNYPELRVFHSHNDKPPIPDLQEPGSALYVLFYSIELSHSYLMKDPILVCSAHGPERNLVRMQN